MLYLLRRTAGEQDGILLGAGLGTAQRSAGSPPREKGSDTGTVPPVSRVNCCPSVCVGRSAG